MQASYNTVATGIERARELLRTGRHAAMATVNEDGTLEHVYFGSHPDSLHSKNVVRTGNLFVVLYDMIERGGLYMKAVNGHKLAGAEFEKAMQAHNKTRARDGKRPIPSGEYELDMYGADIVQFWVNMAERNAAGWVVRDYRHEITREDLLS